MRLLRRAGGELAAEAGDGGKPTLMLLDEVGQPLVHFRRRLASSGPVSLDGLIRLAHRFRDRLERYGYLVREVPKFVFHTVGKMLTSGGSQGKLPTSARHYKPFVFSMARIRTLKPEFWADEKLGPLDPRTRLVFLGLISQADDAGRLVDSVRLLDGLLFPFTGDSCEEPLRVLAELEVIRRGVTASGQRVIQLANWHHQKIDKPNLSAALPPIANSASENELRTVADESAKDRRNVADESAPHISISTVVSVPEPTTADPREKTAATDQGWKVHRDECVAFVTERGYGATERMIAAGEDKTVWQDAKTGKMIPWEDRLGFLRLADARVEDKKSDTLRSALNYVRPQQLDPAKSPTSEQFAAARKDATPVAGTPTVDQTRQKQEAAADSEKQYRTWAERVRARLSVEDPEVVAALEREATDAIGELMLRAFGPTTRTKTLQSKVLELYGARIGDPQPALAA